MKLRCQTGTLLYNKILQEHIQQCPNLQERSTELSELSPFSNVPVTSVQPHFGDEDARCLRELEVGGNS